MISIAVEPDAGNYFIQVQLLRTWSEGTCVELAADTSALISGRLAAFG